MIRELWSEKDAELGVAYLGVISGKGLEGLRNTMKPLSQDGRPPGRNWTRELPNTKQEY
jgi:hypothetical protein